MGMDVLLPTSCASQVHARHLRWERTEPGGTGLTHPPAFALRAMCDTAGQRLFSDPAAGGGHGGRHLEDVAHPDRLACGLPVREEHDEGDCRLCACAAACAGAVALRDPAVHACRAREASGDGRAGRFGLRGEAPLSGVRAEAEAHHPAPPAPQEDLYSDRPAMLYSLEEAQMRSAFIIILGPYR